MRKNGFTLVELLVTISILGILTVIAIPTLRAFQNSNSKAQYLNYKKALNTSGKLYNDSYSEDLFGNASYGCQKVDLTEMMYKKVAKDIDLKDVSCNISSKDSYIIIKKFNNEYKYQASLYCENSNHVEQYSDKDNIISDCINDTGVPWIDVESINDRTKDTKKKSVVIKLLDNYGFTANQSIKYAWTTSESAPADSSTLWKKYNYNNQVKKSSGGTVVLKSNYITIPESATGDYYLYVRPIKVQNILNSSFTETKKYGPFRFDHTAPKCNQITVTPNVPVGSYSQVVSFNFSYASSLDDLKGYSLLISYDNGSHWTTVKTNADNTYTSYTVDKDGDIKYKLANLVDYAGNKTNECSASEVFHRDTVPPICSITVDGTKSSTSGYYYTPTKFNLTSPEMSTVTYGMNTTASTTYNSKNSITITSDGSNGIHGYVKDRAGNEGKCDKSETTTKKYTITFNGNGGTSSPATKEVYWGDKIGNLATATRTNYTPTGWFTASSGGSQVTTSTLMPRGNVTYYAQWKMAPKTVTISFNKNGASSISATSASCTYYPAKDSSCSITTPTITKTGGTVVGWGTSASSTSKSVASGGSVSVSSNATYYAVTYKTLTGTFNYQKGAHYFNGGDKQVKDTCKLYNANKTCTITTPGLKNFPNAADSGCGDKYSKLFDVKGWGTKASASSGTDPNKNISISSSTSYYSLLIPKSSYVNDSKKFKVGAHTCNSKHSSNVYNRKSASQSDYFSDKSYILEGKSFTWNGNWAVNSKFDNNDKDTGGWFYLVGKGSSCHGTCHNNSYIKAFQLNF